MRVSSYKSYLYPVCKQIMFLPAEGIVWVFVSACVSVRMPKWLHADTNWSKNYHKGCFECFGRCFSVVIQSNTVQVRSNWTLRIGVVWKLICDMAGVISSQSHLMDGFSFFDCVYFVFWLIATPDTCEFLKEPRKSKQIPQPSTLFKSCIAPTCSYIPQGMHARLHRRLWHRVKLV